MKVYLEGNGMYGHCWIEGNGFMFWVCVLGGKSKYGPFSSLEDAKKEAAGMSSKRKHRMRHTKLPEWITGYFYSPRYEKRN